MSEENSTFETKDFKIHIEKKSGCLAEVTVNVLPSTVKNLYAKAIKNINKEISVPGFRKGKVPPEMVLQRFSSHVDREWRELLVNGAINYTFQQSKIYPLTKKSVKNAEIKELSLEGGANVFFSYEYFPLLPKIDFSSFNLPSLSQRAVSDQDVQDVLEDMRERAAEWNEITDRAAQEGDYVDLSLEISEEGNLRPLVNSRRFHIVPKKMGAWMRNALIGKEKGATFEVESELDEDATEEMRNNFKKSLIKVTLHNIYQASLPQLDDEFAQNIFKGNLSDLKSDIHRQLEQEALEERNNQKYALAKDFLVDSHVFEVPQSILDSEYQERRKKKSVELQKESHSDVEEKLNENSPLLLEDSKKAIRLYFLKQKIMEQGNITVTTEELIASLTKRYQYNVDEITEDVVKKVRNGLIEEKIRDFVLSQVPA